MRGIVGKPPLLNDEQVEYIQRAKTIRERLLARAAKLSTVAIADRMGVAPSTVRNAAAGKFAKHREAQRRTRVIPSAANRFRGLL